VAVVVSAVDTYEVFTQDSTFDFAHPDLTDLTIEEVAVALGRLFRWRGAIPVTVAQHSVVMSQCASTENVARWCLCHDIPEVLCGDMPGPLKQLAALAQYRKAEDRIMQAVADRFGLTGAQPREVHRLDMRARRSEVEEFLPHAAAAARHYRPLPVLLAPAWTPAQARDAFIAEARRLEIS
jgi:hypothetical protein